MPFGSPLREQQDESVRLPLYAAEAQRTTNHGPNAVSQSREAHDQFLVNCYPILGKNPLGQDGAVHIQTRLGWDLPEPDADAYVDPPTSSTLQYDWVAYPVATLTMTGLNDTMIVVYVEGTNFLVGVYRPSASTVVILDTIAFSTNWSPSSTFVHLSELTLSAANTPSFGLLLSDPTTNKSAGWFKTSSSGTFSGTLTSISDTDFPPNQTPARLAVGPMVQLNENVYVMCQDGRIHNSELDGNGQAQMVNWHTSGYVSTSSYGDRGVGLCRYKHHLVAFGENTIEFFNDEGEAPPASPLKLTQQAFIKVGAARQYAYINIDDTLYWVSNSDAGGIFLYKLDGYTPVLLSQTAPNHLVSDRPYNIRLQTVVMHDIRHLVLNCPVWAHYWFDDGVETGDTLDESLNYIMKGILCYAIDTKAWWIWAEEHQLLSTWDSSFQGYYLFNTINEGNTWNRYSWTTFKDVSEQYTYAIHPRAAPYYIENTPRAGGHDSYRLNDGATIDSYRIPVMLSTNFYDFGNDRRKFLRRLKLIANRIIPNVTTDTAPVPAFDIEGLTLTLAATRKDDLISDEDPEIIRSRQFIGINQWAQITETEETSTIVFGSQAIEDSNMPSTGTIWLETDNGLIGLAYTSIVFAGGDTTVTLAAPYDFSLNNLTEAGTASVFWDNDRLHYYSENNLGAFRRIRFFILCNTFVPLRFEGLELTIAQGTH